MLIEINVGEGISSNKGDRNVKTDDNKNILYADANNLYGHSMSQPLRYNETKFEKDICLNGILNTPDDKDIGYFEEVDLSYPYNIRLK